MSFSFHVPTNLVFGQGAIQKLHKQRLPGKHALIVISSGKSTRANGYLDNDSSWFPYWDSCNSCHLAGGTTFPEAEVSKGQCFGCCYRVWRRVLRLFCGMVFTVCLS